MVRARHQDGSYRNPGRQGHPPPPAPPRPGKTDSELNEERLLQAERRILEAEKRLDAKIREGNGLAKDMQANARAYVEARKDLAGLLGQMKGQIGEAREIVRGMLQTIVDQEVALLRAAMKQTIDHETDHIQKLIREMKESLEDHQAQLLGSQDAQTLVDEITLGVARLLIEEAGPGGGGNISLLKDLIALSEMAESARSGGPPRITADELMQHGGMLRAERTGGKIRMAPGAKKKA